MVKQLSERELKEYKLGKKVRKAKKCKDPNHLSNNLI